MNFGKIKDHVAQARAKAASAAKNFQSLDQMAARDEYINSEGLNVKRKEHQMARKKKEPSVNTSAHHVNGKLNQHSITSQMQQYRTKMEFHKEKPAGNGNSVERSSSAQKPTYILDSVAQAMRENEQMTTNKNHKSTMKGMAKARHPMIEMTSQNLDGDSPNGRTCSQRQNVFSDNYDDDDSIHSYDEDDPIMNMMDPKMPPKINGSKPSPLAGQQTITASRKKDPNRFMADLDKRAAIPISDDIESQQRQQIPSSSNQHQHHQPPVHFLQSFSKAPNKMDWLRNVTSSKNIQQSMAQIIPIMKDNNTSASTNEEEREPLHIPKVDDGDNVNVVDASALFGDDENAELMRIQQQMSMSYTGTLLGMFDKNRHYAVVFITFFLTTFGYLLTRNQTDDSVTRN